jgi:hypothetical protein
MPAFALIREIEARYLGGYYPRSEIAFDPRNDDTCDGEDWTRSSSDDAPDVKHTVPELMYQPSK